MFIEFPEILKTLKRLFSIYSCPAISAFQLVKSTALRLQLLQKTSRAMPLKTSQ